MGLNRLRWVYRDPEDPFELESEEFDLYPGFGDVKVPLLPPLRVRTWDTYDPAVEVIRPRALRFEVPSDWRRYGGAPVPCRPLQNAATVRRWWQEDTDASLAPR